MVWRLGIQVVRNRKEKAGGSCGQQEGYRVRELQWMLSTPRYPLRSKAADMPPSRPKYGDEERISVDEICQLLKYEKVLVVQPNGR